MKFRKKPVVIEAIRWYGDLGRFHHQYEQVFGEPCSWESCADALLIPTLEGEMRADVGDWIIRGVKGEFYPCKPDIFAATYETIGEAAEAFVKEYVALR